MKWHLIFRLSHFPAVWSRVRYGPGPRHPFQSPILVPHILPLPLCFLLGHLRPPLKQHLLISLFVSRMGEISVHSSKFTGKVGCVGWGLKAPRGWAGRSQWKEGLGCGPLGLSMGLHVGSAPRGAIWEGRWRSFSFGGHFWVSGGRCSVWRCINICCTELGKVRLQAGTRREHQPGAPEHEEERMNSTPVHAGPQTWAREARCYLPLTEDSKTCKTISAA